jgi:uncharacterized protein YllA (UPF0747 family)
MKKTLKGKRFATVEEVKTASQEALNNIINILNKMGDNHIEPFKS